MSLRLRLSKYSDKMGEADKLQRRKKSSDRSCYVQNYMQGLREEVKRE